MNYRVSQVIGKAITADVVETIDIDLADPISRIQVSYESRNTGYAASSTHPAGCITKIELIDGSDVLFSLDGYEAEALDFYNNRIIPAANINYLDNGWNKRVYNINFGRYLWDAILAFDPKKFTNPQLKVSIDFNGGGMFPDGGYLYVHAFVFDEKEISPTGFLMSKEIKDYDFVNNGHEYTDLPTDHPYRKLLIRAERPHYRPDEQLKAIKLTEDQDKRVILDLLGEPVIRTLIAESPKYVEGIKAAGATDTLRTHCCTPAYHVNIGGAFFRPAIGVGQLSFYYGDGGQFQQIQDVTGNYNATVQGWCPHGVVEIPFGIQSDIEDWYDVTKVGSIKLDITGGSDTDDCQIFLQQLRRY